MITSFGVLGAMPEEVRLLAAGLQECRSRTLAGVEFLTGRMGGKTVTVCCAGMGKVNAACAAQLLVTVFGARALVFSGIAGNMSAQIGVGDMVLGDVVCYHDAELPMIAQSYPFLTVYRADSDLLAAAEAACREQGVRYLVGRIATGDCFVSDPALKQAILAKCRPACVEMEGAAVAQVAAKNDLPFLILRTMSDDCSEDARQKLVVRQFDIGDYCKTAAAVTAAVLARA